MIYLLLGKVLQLYSQIAGGTLLTLPSSTLIGGNTAIIKKNRIIRTTSCHFECA